MYPGARTPVVLYNKLYDSLFDETDFNEQHYLFGEMKEYNEKTYFRFFRCTLDDFQAIYDFKGPCKPFSAVIVHPTRMFYLDCDLKVASNIANVDRIKECFVFALEQIICQELQTTTDNILIWDASRQRKHYYKISLHVVVPQIIMHYTKIKSYAQIIRWYMNLLHESWGTAIDLQIYHKLQCWRLPYCSNLDVQSVFKSYKSTNISMRQQWKINFLSSTEKYNLSQWIVQIKNEHQDEKIGFNKILDVFPEFSLHRNLFEQTKWIKLNESPHTACFIVVNMVCISGSTRKRGRSRIMYQKHGILSWLQIKCCSKCRREWLFSTNKNIRYPWLYVNDYFCFTPKILRSIDYLLVLLMKQHKILQQNTRSNQLLNVFNRNTIQFDPKPGIVASILFFQNVVCQQCKKYPSFMICQVRDVSHQYYLYGQIAVYCCVCKRYIS